MRFVLGVDEPLYYSQHSAAAKLAPRGGGVFHLARYLKPGETAGNAEREDLEALLDRLQPGWREFAEHVSYRPKMVVSHCLPTVAGPASFLLPHRGDVLFVGDWVSDEGLLADATLASARRAAATILRRQHLAA